MNDIKKEINENKKVVIPEVKSVPVTLKDIVIGDDGKTYEVERIVMLPDFPKK